MNQACQRILCLAVVWITAGCAHAANEGPAYRGMYNVADFGAKGDGKTDDTGAFQDALNAASADGGGLVQVPTGQFLIKTHIAVPQNVTLEGVWRSPQRGDPVSSGSVLLAVEGQGDPDGTPFITLTTQSTLSGISIFYPEQIRANPPHAYPWTIATRTPCDNASIVNVTIINPYQAVDFGTFPTGRHYINGLYAYPLFKGLYINQCYDVGRIENVHFWPFWDLDPKSPLWEFTKTKGTAFIFGRTDGEMVSNCFSIFYSVGMHFIRGEIREDGRVVRTASGAGVFTNCYMDITPCAVRVDDVMSHAGISFVNGMFMSGIEVGPRNKGPVKFTGCGFWANKGQTYHAKLGGRGTVLFGSCHFSNWDQAEEGIPCLDIDSTRAIVMSCDFESDRKDHVKVRLGPHVQAAVVSSNLMGNEVLVQNEAPETASIQIGLNADGTTDAYARRWTVLGPFPNPPVGPDDPSEPSRSGYAIDYTKSVGGEADAVITSQTSLSFQDESATTRTVSARVHEADRNDLVDLKALYPEGGGVAYAFCYVRSPVEQTGRFLLGANDCSKVWVNGQLAHAFWSEEGDSGRPGAHEFETPLQKGLNPVLVKVEDAGGSKWFFSLEAYDARGNALAMSP